MRLTLSRRQTMWPRLGLAVVPVLWITGTAIPSEAQPHPGFGHPQQAPQPQHQAGPPPGQAQRQPGPPPGQMQRQPGPPPGQQRQPGPPPGQMQRPPQPHQGPQGNPFQGQQHQPGPPGSGWQRQPQPNPPGGAWQNQPRGPAPHEHAPPPGPGWHGQPERPGGAPGPAMHGQPPGPRPGPGGPAMGGHERVYQPPPRPRQEAHDWQRQAGWRRQGGWPEHHTWQEHRAQHWANEHRTWGQRGGYGGAYIPRERFYRRFGPDHFFRLRTRPSIYMGYPRFQYGGYGFMFVDPWPEYWSDTWYETDDVYVEYDGDGYYLYNRAYPGVAIAVTVVP